MAARLKKRFYFVAAWYFRFFANFAFRRWHPRVIAVTGSVGKTTMLTLLEKQLGKKAHCSHNANSAFGIAFDLLGLRGVTDRKIRWLYLIVMVPIRSLYYTHKEEFYVAEIDGERPHEAEFLARWLRPEVTLWVSLGRSHALHFDAQVEAGQFENVDKAIAHEFAMLPQYTQKMIYIDGDMPLMVKACEKVKEHHKISAEVIKCYKSSLKTYKVEADGTDFVVTNEVVKGAKFHFYDPTPRDIAIQLDMLTRVCSYLGVKLKTDLKGLQTPPGRNSYFKGINGLGLIDSSYNAHVISMESVLSMVAEIKGKAKWLVLGDMAEQGSIEKEEHEKLAKIVIKIKPEQVVLLGERTRKYTMPLLKKAKIPVYSAKNHREALDFIKAHAVNKETIVFKGSHNQYLGWIVERLLADPSDAQFVPQRKKTAVRCK